MLDAKLELLELVLALYTNPTHAPHLEVKPICAGAEDAVKD